MELGGKAKRHSHTIKETRKGKPQFGWQKKMSKKS